MVTVLFRTNTDGKILQQDLLYPSKGFNLEMQNRDVLDDLK